MENKGILYTEDLVATFQSGSCYVYGAGVDGEDFVLINRDKIKIMGFIDKRKDGTLCGLPIIKAKDFELLRGKIIIATSKYEVEITKELEECGLELGEDFFIWHKNSFQQWNNSQIAEFIEWNKNAWNVYNEESLDSNKQSYKRILVACMDENVYPRYLLYAHLSEFLSNEYEAGLDAYITFRNDFNYGYEQGSYDDFIFDSASGTTREIYRAFGVKEFLFPILNSELKNEAERLTEEIWDEISTWEDWQSICIYNIHFGTTIIRCLNRLFVPCFDPHDEKMKPFLKHCIENIVYWYDRFENYDYKAVLMRDGVSYDGFIRDIAISKGITAVCVHFTGIQALSLDFCAGKCSLMFHRFWNSLSDQEKDKGLKFGRAMLESRVRGKESVRLSTSAFSAENNTRILSNDSKIKVLICPHEFCEDQYYCGGNLFHDNVFEWLCYLGELSNKTDYDWYIKKHPHAEGSYRDNKILESFIRKYPRIKLIPTYVSPYQLKREGLQYVLTVYGTVGCEYPALGIKVITAGDNPYEGFDFTVNPKSLEEYEEILMNLSSEKSEINIQDMYKYWAMNVGYYNWKEFVPRLFINQDLQKIADDLYSNKPISVDYNLLKEELNDNYQEYRRVVIREIWNKAIQYDPNEFYKRQYLND